MLAEVEVVWGKCVRIRMMEQYKRARNDLEALELWGRYDDVTLFLEWGNPSTINDTPKRLVRFIVFVMHPQVFLTPSAGKYAKMQDLQLSVAGKLSKVNTVEYFYQQDPRKSKELFIGKGVYNHADRLGQLALQAVLSAASILGTASFLPSFPSERSQKATRATPSYSPRADPSKLPSPTHVQHPAEENMLSATTNSHV